MLQVPAGNEECFPNLYQIYKLENCNVELFSLEDDISMLCSWYK